ncbi:MAG: nitroreductase family protein [Frankiaceae bacterium]|nr:nitroreductase family protein [Frankiaceae bacterium]
MDVTDRRAEQPLTLAEVREIVELAALAPSVHNTQPWRFSWDGQTLAVNEDPSRALPVLDPAGRERVLSCGAAAQHAELAVRELGRACTTDVEPDRNDPLLVARITVGAAREKTAAEQALVTAIPRRYTDRGVFDPAEVPTDTIDRLRRAAEHHGAWLRPVVDPDERVAMAVLLAHADTAEKSDPAYLAELARWRTHERQQEGVPDAALPGGPVALRGSDFVLRDFDATADMGPPDTAAEPPTPEHPLVVVLGTDDDGREDWIRAGMALGRVLLQATADDLTASPMTQVVEVEPFRARLRRELGMVGQPQVVLRVGYGHGRMTTRRRPVDDVLDVTG